jgi:uncharacterized protein with PIN domain
LAKWLRLLGFDTTFETTDPGGWLRGAPTGERIVITRTRRVRDRRAFPRIVFIDADRPAEQVRRVIETLGLGRADFRPFSLCLRCNQGLYAADRAAVKGRVPDYVWESQQQFHACRECRRVYWPGSHTQRSWAIIEKLLALVPGPDSPEGSSQARVLPGK